MVFVYVTYILTVIFCKHVHLHFINKQKYIVMNYLTNNFFSLACGAYNKKGTSRLHIRVSRNVFCSIFVRF